MKFFVLIIKKIHIELSVLVMLSRKLLNYSKYLKYLRNRKLCYPSRRRRKVNKGQGNSILLSKARVANPGPGS